MFLITRKINGTTETLKNSNSQFNKTFTTYEDAHKFVLKLNNNIIPSKHWKVTEETMEVTNEQS
ncbi:MULTISPECIES: hypothetical protein [unclassified Psychrobacillus]|uniref:hypothetical protein n=1 Tax=unclassified Psychrobacillus TaxID=2636677 RepID=UPI00146C329B|nr:MULTISPECIES: hypothetical protein [unclassified Psychrobacillus]MCM3358300.1 hypothetical protein [Psychrobacillus sp. MER TA 171]NME05548.1 hypothetical protein [Psychrobacillus sp. BL-248-WT-3]